MTTGRRSRLDELLLLLFSLPALSFAVEDCTCMAGQPTINCDNPDNIYAAAMQLHRGNCLSSCGNPSAPYLGNGQRTAAAACVGHFAAVREYREKCHSSIDPNLEAAYQTFRSACPMCNTEQVVTPVCPDIGECDAEKDAMVTLFTRIITNSLKDEGCLAATSLSGCPTAPNACQDEINKIVAFHEKCAALTENIDEFRLSYQSFKSTVKNSGCDHHCSYKSSVATDPTCAKTSAPNNAKWGTPASKVTITLRMSSPTATELENWKDKFIQIFARIHGVNTNQIEGFKIEEEVTYRTLEYTVSGITNLYATYIKNLAQPPQEEKFRYDILHATSDNGDFAEGLSIKFDTTQGAEAVTPADNGSGGDSEIQITVKVKESSQHEINANKGHVEKAIATAHGVNPGQVSITDVRDTPDTVNGGVKETTIIYSVTNDGLPGPSTGEGDKKKPDLIDVKDQARDPDFPEQVEDGVNEICCYGKPQEPNCAEAAEADQKASKCLSDIQVQNDINVVVISTNPDLTTGSSPSAILSVRWALLIAIGLMLE